MMIFFLLVFFNNTYSDTYIFEDFVLGKKGFPTYKYFKLTEIMKDNNSELKGQLKLRNGQIKDIYFNDAKHDLLLDKNVSPLLVFFSEQSAINLIQKGTYDYKKKRVIKPYQFKEIINRSQGGAETYSKSEDDMYAALDFRNYLSWKLYDVELEGEKRERFTPRTAQLLPTFESFEKARSISDLKWQEVRDTTYDVVDIKSGQLIFEEVNEGTLLILFPLRYGDDSKYFVYNKNDFGNFLWGAAMAYIGVPKYISFLGSQANSRLFSASQYPELNEAKTGFKETGGSWDTLEDQRAIFNGYDWINLKK